MDLESINENDVATHQAHLTQKFSAGCQAKLTKMCANLFDEYKAMRKEGRTTPKLTKPQHYFFTIFSHAIDDASKALRN